MFTLYRIAFNVVSLFYTVQCEQIFFAVMVSMILKIFSVKYALDKSKRYKISHNGEGYKNLILLN